MADALRVIIERVQLEVQPGQMAALLDHAKRHEVAIANSKGCRSFSYGQSIENPDRAVFMLEWDSVEAHLSAREQLHLKQFGQDMRPFIVTAAMEHSELAICVSDGDGRQ